jgi:enoyl-CoA hydratase/carnithine racemase
VSRVSKSNDDLVHTANEIVSKITRNSPVAVSVTKSSLNYSRDHSVTEGLQHIALQNSTALMTEDLAKAFMADKRNADGTEFAPLSSHSRL